MMIINDQERAVKSGEEYDEFINRLNERANFFKMKTTGCASVDQKRLQNWSNPAKSINQKRTGIGFYGGAYRKLEYEHVGVGVRLIAIYLKQIEDVPIGTAMARIDNNKLIISAFNGSKPSSVINTFVILEEPTPKPVVTKICARCKKECGDNSMYCSQKCRRKEEKKLFGTMKRQPAREKSPVNQENNTGLKYVLMVKAVTDMDSSSGLKGSVREKT